MTNFEKIKAFIDYKGISIKEFETRVEVSFGFIANLKRHNGATTITSLSKIAHAFPDFDVIGYILSENEQEWQKCLEAVKLPP